MIDVEELEELKEKMNKMDIKGFESEAEVMRKACGWNMVQVILPLILQEIILLSKVKNWIIPL